MGRVDSAVSSDGAGFAFVTAAACDTFLSEDGGV